MSEVKRPEQLPTTITMTITMTITCNKLRIGKCADFIHYCEIEDRKGEVLSGNRTCNLALNFGKRLFSRISSALV